jgi:hypothetical protein
MLVKMELKGQIFGRWTVLERAGKDKRGRCLWNCLCECGTVKIVGGSELRREKSQSCGCLRRELIGERTRLPQGIAELHRRILQYTYRAAKKGLPYELSEGYFISLTKLSCIYCGTEPKEYKTQDTSTNGAFIGNGIDRLDNTKGYILGNVVPCCSCCNMAKGKRTFEDFVKWGERCFGNTLALRERVETFFKRKDLFQ